MAEAVVSFALERIEYLLIHEYNLLSGLEDSVKDLKADLQLMQSFLKDADEKQDENKLVRTCVSEIRDLAFRSENVLENFVIQVASKLEREGFRRFIRNFFEFIPRHRHASEIVNIQNDITKRVERLKGFGIIQVASSSTAHQREPFQRISYPHLIEEDFVGMANDQEQLLSQLGSMDKDNTVITIKGMGGQGKTTMATRLYNHKDLRDKFSNFAWVCVTQTCQTKTIWQDILKQLRPENTDEIMRMGDTVLTEALYKIQQEKKCLVVLDDIWSIQDWHNLQPGFPVRGTTVGSKLLLTTRGLNAKVGHVHELGGLKDDEAWQLLQKKAFPGNGGNPEFQIQPWMEDIGREIVKKCNKLPLAISVLGGILKDKTTSQEWRMLSDNISKYLAKGKEIKENKESVIHVLGLSYNELPYFLKPCFLYLACFPEDYEISTEELYLLWIAEGFVYSSKGEIVMDVARQYLNELAQRSMVTLIHNKFFGYETCRLHDLMREMCIFQGGKDEFFTVIDNQVSAQNPHLVVSPDSCSHRLALSFDKFESVEIPRKQHAAVLRIGSLILRGPKYSNQIVLEAPGIQEFRFLRALQVIGSLSFEYKDLKRIAELIHLRLLIFKGCTVRRFPSCISTLRYLETLGLEVDNDDVIIPNTLGRMKQLRHLFLPHYYIYYYNYKVEGGETLRLDGLVNYKVEGGEKLRLDGLVNLELLSGFDSERCRVEDIGKLKRLGRLRVDFTENGSDDDMRCLIESIKAASYLRNTTLNITSSFFSSEDSVSHLQDLFCCISLQELTIHGPINKLPEPNPNHPFTSSLTYIKLWDSQLREDPMKTLEKLPNLQTLYLWNNAFVGEEMICSTGGFSQLKTLRLHAFKKIKRWEVEDGAMPNLHYLYIHNCVALEMLPSGFKFLKALKQLEIWNMPKIKERVGVEGEDFEKIQHVPSITYHQWKEKILNSKQSRYISSHVH